MSAHVSFQCIMPKCHPPRALAWHEGAFLNTPANLGFVNVLSFASVVVEKLHIASVCNDSILRGHFLISFFTNYMLMFFAHFSTGGSF